MPHRHKKKKAKKAKKQEVPAGKGLAFGLPAKGPGSETVKAPVEVEREQSVVTEASSAADASDEYEPSRDLGDLGDLGHAQLDGGSNSSPSRPGAADRKTGREVSASSSLSPVQQSPPVPAAKKPRVIEEDSSDSEDDHQPPPAPAVPHMLTFGDDPWDFPDPTRYELKRITPDMSEDEIRKNCSVADYPRNDLSDLIPGTPPDKDFSSAKPTNQVQATTFATYADQYLRPLNEEDLAFLRERGDRVTPFIIPPRGKKHYTEIWAEEDGLLPPEQHRDKYPANQPRGSIDNLNDAIAETDEISVGPVLSRVMSLLRPEARPDPNANAPNGAAADANSNADLDATLGFGPAEPEASSVPTFPAATYMTDSGTEAWKKANHPKLDHAQVDERLKQELRYLGFMPPDQEPDYDAAYDDEVAARLRVLQAKLKEQAIVNAARKARLADIAKEKMAFQEFTTILEDLDTQVQSMYTKRNRSMQGKKSKSKRPGAAAHASVGAVARPGIGDAAKTLMDRRKKWQHGIGPVFDDDVSKVPRAKDEGSSIFKEEDMKPYLERERAAWEEEEGEEE